MLDRMTVHDILMILPIELATGRWTASRIVGFRHAVTARSPDVLEEEVRRNTCTLEIVHIHVMIRRT